MVKDLKQIKESFEIADISNKIKQSLTMCVTNKKDLKN